MIIKGNIILGIIRQSATYLVFDASENKRNIIFNILDNSYSEIPSIKNNTNIKSMGAVPRTDDQVR